MSVFKVDLNLFRQYISYFNTTARETAYDQAQVRSKRPLIRPNSDHGPDYKNYGQTFQTEVTSDQTEPRPWSRLLCTRTAVRTQ